MAQQALVGGMYFPPSGYLSAGLTNTTYVIDASGEIAALVFRVPKTGNVTRFGALINAVGNAPDNGLRYSFQDVSLTTGLPDGVVDQFATIASGSVTTGWLDPGDFDSPRAVTRGQLLALVLDFPSFVAGDSVTVSGYTSAIDSSPGIGHGQYGVSATNTKQSFNMPVFALRYDDGTYPYIRGTMQVSTLTSISSLTTATTPDEVGMAFTLPFPAALAEVSFAGAVPAGANFDIVIYDSGGSALSATASVDGDVTASGASRIQVVMLSANEVLAANSLYRVVVKPTTTTANMTFFYTTHGSAAFMGSCPGGAGFYMTTRADAGAWTNYNNVTDGFRRPMMQLRFDTFDDAVSTGGINRAAFPSGLSSLG